jgi:RNA polymerase sigma-70 factor, ECF subfamily
VADNSAGSPANSRGFSTPENASRPAKFRETPPFEEFYESRSSGMRRYAGTILGTGEADDACQDAWLRIWRAWGTADPDRLDAWAFRIVRNCCLDRRRGAKPTVPLVEMALPHVPSPEDMVASRLDAVQATAVLSELPLPQREALWLREAAMMSYAEIAEVQGIPMGTVMSRLHKARRKALKLLKRWER